MRRTKPNGTGAALRKLRLARGWTLETLSKESGVPISTLSRAELGQSALHHDKLVRLCQTLDVDPQSLVKREAEPPAVSPGRRAVTRMAEGADVRVGPSRGRRAAAELPSKGFSPVMLDIRAGDLGEHGPFVTLPGEAYLLVLAGRVEFHSPRYAPLPMAVGDAVWFDAAAGYAAIAPHGPARALLVVSGETVLAGQVAPDSVSRGRGPVRLR